ncbi:MAG: hypothetical protein ACON31_09480 [Candidatus Puniceispirillaceae bacterium]
MDPSPQDRDIRTQAHEAGAGEGRSADLSVWVIWAVIMLLAIAALPFVVRSQDVVRAIAQMCGFDLG